jgi:hypothetical protein
LRCSRQPTFQVADVRPAKVAASMLALIGASTPWFPASLWFARPVARLLTAAATGHRLHRGFGARYQQALCSRAVLRPCRRLPGVRSAPGACPVCLCPCPLALRGPLPQSMPALRSMALPGQGRAGHTEFLKQASPLSTRLIAKPQPLLLALLQAARGLPAREQL